MILFLITVAILLVFLPAMIVLADYLLQKTCETCGAKFKTGIMTSAWCLPCRGGRP